MWVSDTIAVPAPPMSSARCEVCILERRHSRHRRRISSADCPKPHRIGRKDSRSDRAEHKIFAAFALLAVSHLDRREYVQCTFRNSIPVQFLLPTSVDERMQYASRRPLSLDRDLRVAAAARVGGTFEAHRPAVGIIRDRQRRGVADPRTSRSLCPRLVNPCRASAGSVRSTRISSG